MECLANDSLTVVKTMSNIDTDRDNTVCKENDPTRKQTRAEKQPKFLETLHIIMDIEKYLIVLEILS